MAAYAANAILVLLSEWALSSTLSGRFYLIADLITQCVYTIAAGYLCCWIAKSSGRSAIAGLIGLAILVGTVSLLTSWKTEPHWYGIALLAVYPPCAWIGWTLKARA